MIGLKRGTVKLIEHQDEWRGEAEKAIESLKGLLAGVAVDIQHVGSTAVPSIHAKPILDVVVGVRKLEDILAYKAVLEQSGVVFRGEDVKGQLLFVMGDFEKDVRTHHIHVVEWNGSAWKNYINFRDYLNAFPEKARMYDACKQRLASRFPDDRKRYTAGKQERIDCLLAEAAVWRAEQKE